MKKSNKILLGGLLTVVLLLAAVHIALYAKYRNGHYIPYTNELQSMVMQSFPHAKFVSLHNIENAVIEQGDSLKTEKKEKDEVSYVQRGDTLHISTDTSNQRRYWGDVYIQLPEGISVAAVNSRLSFQQSIKTAASDLAVYLNNSTVSLSTNSNNKKLQLTTLQVDAFNNSNIELNNSNITNLNVLLQQSTLNDMSGSIDSLSITTDPASRISLQAKHFTKAKVNTTVYE